MSTLTKLPQMSPKRVANKGTNQGRALKETFAMSRLTFSPIVFPMAPMAEVSGYRSGSAERKESSDTSAFSSRGFKTYGTPMGSAGTSSK